jgi:hypothetical protein
VTAVTDESVGLREALEKIETLRQELGANCVMAFFDVGGEMVLVADEFGTDVFANGERVPRKEGE